jgi:cation/acetate symporter
MNPGNLPAIATFLLFVGATLVITWWAHRRTQTAQGFYAADSSVSALQNGVATAGDYLSAASFLGTIAIFYGFGTDGLLYALGAAAGWPMLACLLSERLRALGRYSLADVLSHRLAERPIRIMTATATLSICGTYLIAQMVAAGTIVQVLFGLPYVPAVIIVGSLMVSYVLFGGMVATTWIQIVKASLLLAGAALMAALVLVRFDWNFSALLARSLNLQDAGAGRLLHDPFSAACLALAFCCGPAGMPHILMRSFTVRSSADARRSLVYATALIALFQLLVIVLGNGAVVLLKGGGIEPTGGANMAAVMLARVLGGNFLFGIIASLAFATILAVVSGLTLAAATAVSHDLLRSVLPRGTLSESSEVKVSKAASVGIGMFAMGLGVLFQHENVGFLATLPLVIAASANFPVLLLALYWRRLTTAGALAAGWTGLVSSVVLVVGSPKVWVGTFGHAQPLFNYEYPTILTMGSAFLLAIVVSLFRPKRTREAQLPAQAV